MTAGYTGWREIASLGAPMLGGSTTLSKSILGRISEEAQPFDLVVDRQVQQSEAFSFPGQESRGGHDSITNTYVIKR